jgi:hypothetical protein
MGPRTPSEQRRCRGRNGVALGGNDVAFDDSMTLAEFGSLDGALNHAESAFMHSAFFTEKTDRSAGG